MDSAFNRRPRSRRCCVSSCNSYASGSSLSFFSFPRGYTLKRKWRHILKLEKNPKLNARVCSKHFASTDIIQTAHKRRIKEGTVPSKNLPSFNCTEKELRKIEVEEKEPSNHPADPISVQASVPEATQDGSTNNAEKPSTTATAAAPEGWPAGSVTDTNALLHHLNGREDTPNPSGLMPVSGTGLGTGTGVKMLANVPVSCSESEGTKSDKRKHLPPKKWRWTTIPCIVTDAEKRPDTPQAVLEVGDSAAEHSLTSGGRELAKTDRAHQTSGTEQQDSPQKHGSPSSCEKKVNASSCPDAERNGGKTSGNALIAGARTLFVGSNGAITEKLPAISNSKSPLTREGTSSNTPDTSGVNSGTALGKTIVISAKIRRRSEMPPKRSQFSTVGPMRRYASVCSKDPLASGSSATRAGVCARGPSTEPPAKAPRLLSVPFSPSPQTPVAKPRQTPPKSSRQVVNNAPFREGQAGVSPSVKENTCIVKPTVATGPSATKESAGCEEVGLPKKLSTDGGRPTGETPLNKSEIVRKALGVTVVSASLIIRRVPEKPTTASKPSALVRPSLAADPDTTATTESGSDCKQIPAWKENCVSGVESPKESSNAVENKGPETLLLRKSAIPGNGSERKQIPAQKENCLSGVDSPKETSNAVENKGPEALLLRKSATPGNGSERKQIPAQKENCVSGVDSPKESSNAVENKGPEALLLRKPTTPGNGSERKQIPAQKENCLSGVDSPKESSNAVENKGPEALLLRKPTTPESGSERKQIPAQKENCLFGVNFPKESSNAVENKGPEALLLRKPTAAQKALGLTVISASLIKHTVSNGSAEREGTSPDVPFPIKLRETNQPAKKPATRLLASVRKPYDHPDRPGAKGFASSSGKAPQLKSETSAASDSPMIIVHSGPVRNMFKKPRIQTSKTPRSRDAIGGDATPTNHVSIKKRTAPPRLQASATHQSIISQMNSLQQAQDDLRALHGDYNSMMSLISRLQRQNLFLERKLQLVRKERRCRKCLKIRPDLSAAGTQTDAVDVAEGEAEGYAEARASEAGTKRVERPASETAKGESLSTIDSTGRAEGRLERAEARAGEPQTVTERAEGVLCEIEVKEERMEDCTYDAETVT